MYSLYVHVMAPAYPQKQYAASAEHSFISLLLVIVANIVCISLTFNTIKIQQFSLVTKFTRTYNSSNLR